MSGSVVVTGCGRGIGHAIVTTLLAAGYAVLGIELDDTGVEQASTLIGSRGEVVRGDVADRAVHDRAADAAGRFAPLVGWVNNAAVQRMTNLHEVVEADVERTLAVNLLGYYWGCSAAVTGFIAQGSSGGAIVNVSSAHARAGYSNHAAYDVSKGGVEALTRYVAVEYGAVGIRCNGVAPGAVRTPLFERVIGESPDPAAAEQEAIRPHPLGRAADPSEIASVVGFLLGPGRPS